MSTRKGICALAVALFALVTTSAQLPAAEQSQETAARALLGEAEKLIELALPQEALPVLEQVKSECAGTEAALYAELRKAVRIAEWRT